MSNSRVAHKHISSQTFHTMRLPEICEFYHPQVSQNAEVARRSFCHLEKGALKTPRVLESATRRSGTGRSPNATA